MNVQRHGGEPPQLVLLVSSDEIDRRWNAANPSRSATRQRVREYFITKILKRHNYFESTRPGSRLEVGRSFTIPPESLPTSGLQGTFIAFQFEMNYRLCFSPMLL